MDQIICSGVKNRPLLVSKCGFSQVSLQKADVYLYFKVLSRWLGTGLLQKKRLLCVSLSLQSAHVLYCCIDSQCQMLASVYISLFSVLCSVYLISGGVMLLVV